MRNRRNLTTMITTLWIWKFENLLWRIRKTIITGHHLNYLTKISRTPWYRIIILIKTTTKWTPILHCHPATTLWFNIRRMIKMDTTIQSILHLLPVLHRIFMFHRSRFNRASSIHLYTFNTLSLTKETCISQRVIRLATICPCTRAYR